MANFKFTLWSIFNGKGLDEAKTKLDNLTESAKEAGKTAKAKLDGIGVATDLVKGNFKGAIEKVGKFGAALAGLGTGPLVLIGVAAAGIIKLWKMWKEHVEKVKQTIHETTMEKLRTETEKWRDALSGVIAILDKQIADDKKALDLQNNKISAETNLATAKLKTQKIEAMIAAETEEERAEIEKAYNHQIALAEATDKVATKQKQIDDALNEANVLEDKANQLMEARNKNLEVQEKLEAQIANYEATIKNMRDGADKDRMNEVLEENKKKLDIIVKANEDWAKKADELNTKAQDLRNNVENVLTVEKNTLETNVQQISLQEQLTEQIEKSAEAAEKKKKADAESLQTQKDLVATLKQANAEQAKADEDKISKLEEQVKKAKELKDALDNKSVAGDKDGDGKLNRAERAEKRRAEHEERKAQRKAEKEEARMQALLKDERAGIYTASKKEQEKFDEWKKKKAADAALKKAEDAVKKARDEAKLAADKRATEIANAVKTLNEMLEKNLQAK